MRGYSHKLREGSDYTKEFYRKTRIFQGTWKRVHEVRNEKHDLFDGLIDDEEY
jgi:hypothetical protein